LPFAPRYSTGIKTVEPGDQADTTMISSVTDGRMLSQRNPSVLETCTSSTIFPSSQDARDAHATPPSSLIRSALRRSPATPNNLTLSTPTPPFHQPALILPYLRLPMQFTRPTSPAARGPHSLQRYCNRVVHSPSMRGCFSRCPAMLRPSWHRPQRSPSRPYTNPNIFFDMFLSSCR